MPKLTVNNNTYDYPDPGSEPGWGSDATDWASDVTTVLNSISGSGTIIETAFDLEATATNAEVAGLQFAASAVQGAEVAYTIVRSTNSEKLNESGILEINYDASVPGWKMTRRFTGSDAGTKVALDITGTNIGQVVYTSTALTGTGYVGKITFKTISIVKPT